MRYSLTLLFISLGFVRADDKPMPVKIGNLSATPPASWKSEKPANRLRSHQFKLASGDKDFADAEVSVSPDFNPDPEKSKPRWKGEYVLPDAVKPEDAMKEGKFEVNGATVHTLDITGTWKYKERPFDPKSKEELRPEYRTIWALVVVKDEATMIKLSGPMKVVAKHKSDFDGWLKSLK